MAAQLPQYHNESDTDSGSMEYELFKEVDTPAFTALSPEIMSQQATINIGTIGHVAHGKSTVVRAISGVNTVRFKNELQRNITIKLGYGNAKIFKCSNLSCPRPECYKSYPSSTRENPTCKRPACHNPPMELVRHLSFVDCPGHDVLMSTMLNGASVMDGALLVVAGNEKCPQPQTAEHLAAVEIMDLKHKSVVIVQNKVDLVSRQQAMENQQSITDFVRGTLAESSPIVPVSGQMSLGIDALVHYIVNSIPVPVRDFTSPPRLTIVRSFDVNKPGTPISRITGGVVGGTLMHGVLRPGMQVEIRPGRAWQRPDGKWKAESIITRVATLSSEGRRLDFAAPGGLIGVETLLDPSVCKGDKLVGQMLGIVGSLPHVFIELTITLSRLRHVLGSSTREKVSKPRIGEMLLLHIGSKSTGGRILSIGKDSLQLRLSQPCCAEIGEKLTLSRKVETHWRLIGWGQVESGTVAD